MKADFETLTVGCQYFDRPKFYNPTNIVVDNVDITNEVINYRYSEASGIKEQNLKNALSVGKWNIKYKN